LEFHQELDAFFNSIVTKCEDAQELLEKVANGDPDATLNSESARGLIMTPGVEMLSDDEVEMLKSGDPRSQEFIEALKKIKALFR